MSIQLGAGRVPLAAGRVEGGPEPADLGTGGVEDRDPHPEQRRFRRGQPALSLGLFDDGEELLTGGAFHGRSPVRTAVVALRLVSQDKTTCSTRASWPTAAATVATTSRVLVITRLLRRLEGREGEVALAGDFRGGCDDPEPRRPLTLCAAAGAPEARRANPNLRHRIVQHAPA
ncbi:hypothetical protein AF335_06185 [Streptomyces eurocidicus]|uniref:Uncharacterized protein n=1 Tax=Streptomyces eurocidicus TaxID=66423 RepID=A0A2N8NZN9_STREU|nr:hypothetical protein AF335_06185 [Streptomyces eurocidicus]